LKLLIDTHLLLWAAADTLPKDAVPYFTNEENELFFSSASIWEIVIKKSLKRPDFQVDPKLFHQGLLDNGYMELGISGYHTLLVDGLPKIHKDPFDRILVAQAKAENAVLLTSDKALSRYSPVIYVKPGISKSK